jgi:hypothetical protein
LPKTVDKRLALRHYNNQAATKKTRKQNDQPNKHNLLHLHRHQRSDFRNQKVLFDLRKQGARSSTGMVERARQKSSIRHRGKDDDRTREISIIRRSSEGLHKQTDDTEKRGSIMKPKNNPVAKHCRTFNKATVQRDRKKAAKRGARKHKGRDWS